MNEYKRKTIEDRLQLLDALEALYFQAPHQEHYDEMLSEFGISTTPAAMQADLNELNRSGVASFILTEGLTRWNFWDFPVRIKNIDPTKVSAMQQSLRGELASLADEDPITSSESSRSAEMNDEQNRQSGSEIPRDATDGPMLFIAVMGFVGTVASTVAVFWSWHVLRTNSERVLALASTIMFVVVCTRIYLRARSRELPWRAVFDIFATAALCICVTLTIIWTIQRTGR